MSGSEYYDNAANFGSVVMFLNTTILLYKSGFALIIVALYYGVNILYYYTSHGWCSLDLHCSLPASFLVCK